MIDYNSFYIASSVLWGLSIVFLLLSIKNKQKFLKAGLLLNGIAILVMACFIVYLWQKLDDRPCELWAKPGFGMPCFCQPLDSCFI